MEITKDKITDISCIIDDFAKNMTKISIIFEYTLTRNQKIFGLPPIFWKGSKLAPRTITL